MMSERKCCPDGGRCHHACQPNECYRVRCCAPLSGVYADERWPFEVQRQYGYPTQVEMLRDERDKARAERDEARRMFCETEAAGFVDVLVVAAMQWGREVATTLWSDEDLRKYFVEIGVSDTLIDDMVAKTHATLDRAFPTESMLR